MRKIIYTTGVVVAMAILPSCKKYLDIVPVGKVIPTTVEDFRKELDAGYALSDQDKGLAAYRGDEIRVNESSSGDVNQVFNSFTWDENGSSTGNTYNWRSKYQQIFYANHIIAAVPAATGGTDEEKDQLIGEAYLMRAYVHFNLVNLYGNAYNEATAATDKAVPVVTAVDVEKVSRRNTVKEVYNQVFADLDKGMSLMNVDNYPTAQSYKFSKVVGQAMAARVYLYTHQWEKALTAAKAVMGQKNTLIDFNTSTVLPTLYNAIETIQARELIYNTGTSRAMIVSDKLFSLYNATGDLRLQLYYGKDSKGNNIIKKISDNNSYRQSFRVGEIYLTAAEAAAQLNQPDVARTYLNQLKQHRLTPAFFATEQARIAALTGKDLLNEIYDERARELAFEGHRWFDLRRTSQPELVHKLKGKIYTLKAGDPRYTIQIPLEALANNPLLKE
ncbi:RagB/SusD family nutrient uptake outer membrane protein [Chitinophaga eiseniae]|uniref:RagB/SusD family nutrient uptake outer membrane protein n=1 Tax=Chitinophaga eiseniae TaxID=634771 RepID=A0A847STS1_9BACT|nr:RagB/SusD family nutrient uptake outer membrane protein [Chitinophaga eiseniae]NLR79832.1 RagB/SusD family nutrient uptake outer membrane protein [Chitinophaga eiseniae]